MSDLETEISYNECDICYLKKPKSEFFSLKCCKNYSICKTCVEFLVQPKCPFCRVLLDNLPQHVRSSRSTSISTADEFFRPIEEPISNYDTGVTSFDDTFTYSRIYRRRMRRYTKLRQRELLSIRNRERNVTFNSQNRKKGREMKNAIKDGIEQYKKNKEE